MGYWLEDNDGKWLGDLATNKGIGQLREAGSPALKEFLDAGEADEKLVESVIEEVEELPVVAYVVEMLGKAEGSVFVTDGCGSAEDGNQEEKHAQHDQSTHGRGGGRGLEKLEPTANLGKTRKAFRSANIEVGFEVKEIDSIRSAKAMYTKLAELTSEYPRLAGFVAEQPVMPLIIRDGRYFESSKGQKIQGVYRGGKKREEMEVVGNPASREQKKRPSIGRWHVGDDAQTLFVHEYGHKFHAKGLTETERGRWESVASKSRAESPKFKPLSEEKPFVSEYANANNKEMFAESFAAYTHKGYRRGMIPKDVESFFDGVLKK